MQTRENQRKSKRKLESNKKQKKEKAMQKKVVAPLLKLLLKNCIFDLFCRSTHGGLFAG